MDRTNRKILRALESNGRITNTELAQMVGLSASACLRRVQELENAGVIKGYRAIIDRESVGAGFTVIATIALSDHSKASQRSFEDAILAAPQVRECHNVAGNFEYILRVETENLEAYKQFHMDVLGTIPVVRGITSYISMQTVKDDRG